MSEFEKRSWMSVLALLLVSLVGIGITGCDSGKTVVEVCTADCSTDNSDNSDNSNNENQNAVY